MLLLISHFIWIGEKNMKLDNKLTISARSDNWRLKNFYFMIGLIFSIGKFILII